MKLRNLISRIGYRNYLTALSYCSTTIMFGRASSESGKNVPNPIVKLCEMEEAMRYVIQDRFAQLGARWIAADSADQLSAMYRSTSWRLTKPLRAIRKSWQTL